jgi:hypothetical protein
MFPKIPGITITWFFCFSRTQPMQILRTTLVVQFVKLNPGCRRADILSALPYPSKPMTISNTLGRLQRAKVIENRTGGRAQYAQWYPVDARRRLISATSPNSSWKNLANLETPVAKPDYLARRLQEIYG